MGLGQRPHVLLLSVGGALVLHHRRCPLVLAAPPFCCLGILVGGLQLLLGTIGGIHSSHLLCLYIVKSLYSPPLPLGIC